MQWFRGSFEATYVGTPMTQPFLSRHGAGEHFQLRVYRAAVHRVALVAPPEAEHLSGAALESESSPNTFFQARIDDARVSGVRGRGGVLYGPIFDVRVSDAKFSHLTYQNGRAYGKLVGTAVGWVELPEEPLVELDIETGPEPHEGRPPALAARGARKEPAQVAAGTAATADLAGSFDPELDVPDGLTMPARDVGSQAHTRKSTLPLFPLSIVVAIALAIGCGAQPALLWGLFMLPTLLCRKLFHDVLDDSPALRAFGGLLVLVQLCAIAVLLRSWWTSDCKELEVLPMIGLVAVIFPAGLLPSALPLVCNAAGLTLVLGMWCSGPSGACREESKAQRPSVQHPGVPRTNEDGSWPRRPPG